jgi:hypothetical protein
MLILMLFLVAWFVGYVLLPPRPRSTMWSFGNVCFELHPGFGVELLVPYRVSCYEGFMQHC